MKMSAEPTAAGGASPAEVSRGWDSLPGDKKHFTGRTRRTRRAQNLLRRCRGEAAAARQPIAPSIFLDSLERRAASAPPKILDASSERPAEPQRTKRAASNKTDKRLRTSGCITRGRRHIKPTWHNELTVILTNLSISFMTIKPVVGVLLAEAITSEQFLQTSTLEPSLLSSFYKLQLFSWFYCNSVCDRQIRQFTEGYRTHTVSLSRC